MTTKTFITQLLLIFGGCSLLNLTVPPFSTYAPFSWGSLILFANLTVLMYVGAARSVVSSNKNQFTTVFLGCTMLKMLISLSFVLYYKVRTNPTGTVFIVPFLMIFVVFTIFETYFLHHIAKN